MSNALQLWTVTLQIPLSMGVFRQEYWSGLPCPPPGDLHDPGIKILIPTAPALQMDFFTTESLGKPKDINRKMILIVAALFAIEKTAKII